MDTFKHFFRRAASRGVGKEAGLVGDVVGSVPGLGRLRPANLDHPFAQAVQEVAEQQMRQEALRDVGGVGLAGLGAGAGAAGLVGLARMFRKRKKPTEERVLPLPYPVEEEDHTKKAGITSKAALPWYGPAVVFGGLAGLGLGWKGVDGVLKRRARKEREDELSAAREEFNAALLSQYDKPLRSPALKLSADGELAAALDDLFDKTQLAVEKVAATLADAGGMALGGYGTYAGLTSLLAGSIVYDQLKKRSRQAILDKAIKKRERRKYMESPPEIYAEPQPMPVEPTAGR